MGMSKQRLITFSVFSTATVGLLAAYIALKLTVKECDAPPYLDTFDATAYMGRWYGIARNSNLPFQSGDCVTADYTLQANGLVEVVNSQFFFDTNTLDDIVGKAAVN